MTQNRAGGALRNGRWISKTATDRLAKKSTADDLAEAFGVARNMIARARLDPLESGVPLATSELEAGAGPVGAGAQQRTRSFCYGQNLKSAVR